MRGLFHDKTPNLVKTISEPKKNMTAIEVSKKRTNESSESVIDVVDSLIRIFDPDYKPEEDVNLFENFNISNEPKLGEPQAKKQKRNDISRNIDDKYQCQQCDYKASQSTNLRIHVEAIHEGVRYTCNQCDYKATHERNLRGRKEYLSLIHI